MDLGIFFYNFIRAKEPLEIIMKWEIYNEITKDYKLIATSKKYHKNIVCPEGVGSILNQKILISSHDLCLKKFSS